MDREKQIDEIMDQLGKHMLQPYMDTAEAELERIAAAVGAFKDTRELLLAFGTACAVAGHRMPTATAPGSLLDVEDMLEGLGSLDLELFHVLGEFDDDEGGYYTAASLAQTLGKPVDEVRAAAESLVEVGLAVAADDLETSKGVPLGDMAYARFEDGQSLLNIYHQLQSGERRAAKALERHKGVNP